MTSGDLFLTIFLLSLALLLLGIGLKKAGFFRWMVEGVVRTYAQSGDYNEATNSLLAGLQFGLIDDNEYHRLLAKYLPFTQERKA